MMEFSRWVYVGFMMAQKGTLLHVSAMQGWALSQEEAIGLGKIEALRKWPLEDGWTDHDCGMVPLLDSFAWEVYRSMDKKMKEGEE